MAELPLFWQQVLEQSRLLDIETAGLDPRQYTPISAAMKKYGAPGAAEATWFKFETAEMIPEAPFRRYTPIREAVPPMEPFAQQMWTKSWAEQRARFLAEGGKLQRPREFFTRMFQEAGAEGGFLWAHNVHFDISQFASQYAQPSAVEALYGGMSVEAFYPYKPGASRIWPTQTREAFAFRRMAYETPGSALGAMRGWYGEYRTMVQEALTAGRPTVLDSMFIGQAMMAMAQEQNYMAQTMDIFTGARLESLHSAFRLGEYAAHLDVADVGAMEALLPELLTTTEALYEGRDLTGRQAEALYRLGRMQPRMAEQNVRVAFAQAQQELRGELGQFRYTTKGGVQHYSGNYEDILRIYEKRQAGLKYGMPTEEIWRQVGAATDEEISAILAARREVPKLTPLEGLGARFAFAKAETKMFWNKRGLAGKIALGVAGASAVAGAAWMLSGGSREGVPGDKDAYNSIEALVDRGQAGSLRRMITDFGSGWRGLIGLPREVIAPMFGGGIRSGTQAFYVKQDVVKFMERSLRRQLKLSQLAKRGRGIGMNLTPEETELTIRAIRQLQATTHRAEGARIVFDDVIASSTLSDLKYLLRHEGLHEAAVYSDEVGMVLERGRMRHFSRLAPDAAVRKEVLQMTQVTQLPGNLNIAEPASWEAIRAIQGPGLNPSGITIGEEMALATERIMREEFYAYQFGDEFTQYKSEVTKWLNDFGAQVSSTFMDELKTAEKNYRVATLAKDRTIKLQRDAKRTRDMTMYVNKKYAPDGHVGIRQFYSPHLTDANGNGMVIRMAKVKKQSHHMYQP